MLTKATIETLTDAQVLALLELKWIHPLMFNIGKLPDAVIHTLAVLVQALAKKYETTFAEVEVQIRDTEKALSSLIDELECGEHDRKGLSEFQALLTGESNG